MPSELTLPYIGEDWTKAYNPLKETRCGHLKATAQTACYIVHRDPKLLTMTENQIITTLKDEDFIAAKKEAATFKATYLKPTSNNFYMYNTDEVKNTLAQGKAVILELDFYYAAWNHREAEDFGLTRNMDHWSKGIVSAPEVGSVDTEKSEANPAGHSILVVGFDDNKIVTKQVLMKDGTTKTFTYKGVYYFKNSWGTSSFGANFEVDGKKFPGYGMITYKYAEEKGAFFKLEI
jgi:C1A family cysteine protease